MIRERDRALHEKDRLSGVSFRALHYPGLFFLADTAREIQANREEVEKLKRELRFALEKADNLERSKGTELSSMLSKYNREMADLEEALRVCFPYSSSASKCAKPFPEEKSRPRGDSREVWRS